MKKASKLTGRPFMVKVVTMRFASPGPAPVAKLAPEAPGQVEARWLLMDPKLPSVSAASMGASAAVVKVDPARAMRPNQPELRSAWRLAPRRKSGSHPPSGTFFRDGCLASARCQQLTTPPRPKSQPEEPLTASSASLGPAGRPLKHRRAGHAKRALANSLCGLVYL